MPLEPEVPLDAEFTAKWRDRAALDPLPREVLGVVLDRFIASEGSVGIETLVSLLADRDPAEVRGAIALLDEKDLLLARDGQVLLAYPFSGVPNAFRVVFPDGRERYAWPGCCWPSVSSSVPRCRRPRWARGPAGPFSRCARCDQDRQVTRAGHYRGRRHQVAHVSLSVPRCGPPIIGIIGPRIIPGPIMPGPIIPGGCCCSWRGGVMG